MLATAPDTTTSTVVTSRRQTTWWRRLIRGRETDAPWVRLSLIGLLAFTALMYLWNLGASGWANAFYSAAVQAGTQSWKALFFGSFDSSNFITVDKPPAALWVMELSARVFGLSSWSILVPEALEGVVAVGILYATVRRWFSPMAALLAGMVMALTPVAALMFRFNNPDALLTLLLVAAAYALTRALENGCTRWLVLAGALIGFAFLTKMLQAFIVVPPFALVYLVAAPVSLRRRITQLVAFGLSMLVSASWWVAAVVLTPASARPYVGGSQNNSILNLIFGYNGFGRLTGNEAGNGGGGFGNGGGFGGATGLFRMFNSEFGGQVSWLLPAALIGLAALLWLTLCAPRTDRLRAAALLWGGWLLVTGAVFSYAQGIIHSYYTVALAPAIGALVGISAVTLWDLRERWVARVALATAVGATAIWSYVLLDRTPDWYPWLRVIVLVLGVTSALVMLAGPWVRRQAAVALATIAIMAVLTGPAAYAIDTVATPHSAALPSAGPAVARAFDGGSSGGGNGPGNFGPGGSNNSAGQGNGQGGFPGGPGGFVPGNAAGGPPLLPGGQTPFGRAGRGGMRVPLGIGTPSSTLVKLLQANSDQYTWVAATVGANSAAGMQLTVDEPVMAIGGFSGTDPAPTLAEFQQLVREGKIHYFIAGGFGGGRGGIASEITSWVEQNFTAKTVGGTTVYDLTQPTTGSTSSSAG